MNLSAFEFINVAYFINACYDCNQYSIYLDPRGEASAAYLEREEHHDVLLQSIRCQAVQNIP